MSKSWVELGKVKVYKYDTNDEETSGKNTHVH